jgi:hypothetical protein
MGTAVEDRCGFSAKIGSAALDLSRLFACTARLAAFSRSASLLRILGTVCSYEHAIDTLAEATPH